MPDRLLQTTAETTLTNYLEERGLRRTPERFAILGQAIGMKGHFSPAMLYAAVEKSGFTVSRATVYNNLALFVDAGIFTRLRSNTSVGYEYELATTKSSSHIHLVCHVCGKVREVRSPEIFSKLAQYHFPGFGVNGYEVNFLGICTKCQRQQKKSKTNKITK